MQIVININEGGKVSTATLPDTGNDVGVDDTLSTGALDGGSSPAGEDAFSDSVTEISPRAEDFAFDGGSA